MTIWSFINVWNYLSLTKSGQSHLSLQMDLSNSWHIELLKTSISPSRLCLSTTRSAPTNWKLEWRLSQFSIKTSMLTTLLLRSPARKQLQLLTLTRLLEGPNMNPKMEQLCGGLKNSKAISNASFNVKFYWLQAWKKNHGQNLQ